MVEFDDPLPVTFFERPTVVVARELIGTVLARRGPQGPLRAGRIVETEAYVEGDPANHAFRGPTRRNWTMFTGPGHLYVYRIHQVHCANVTTSPGEAVLLRAVEPLTGGLGNPRGPGLLCRAFSLTKEEDGLSVIAGEVRVLPADRPVGEIVTTPRIGVREGKVRLLRFAERGSPWLSRPIPSRAG
jgi:DNA-3-methyladenine glycosylase